VFGKGGMKVHEEAWNSYPYCKTVITNPGYLKSDFKIVFETLHVDDAGNSNNVLGIENYDKTVDVVTLDIASETCPMTAVDAALYRSKMANRGPLNKKNWR
jgi:hypothetical protein